MKTGRELWPWTERKVGIYHQRISEVESVWVILRPTAAVLGLCEASLAAETFSSADLHLSIFQSSLFTWKFYLRYLDHQVRKDVSICTAPWLNTC